MGGGRGIFRQLGLQPIAFEDKDENEEEDERVTAEDEYDNKDESNISVDED